MATFRADPPPYYPRLLTFSYVFESMFFLYTILQFIKEYTPEFQLTPVRNLKLICRNYLETQFKWDIIPLIPLQEIKFGNNRNRLFFLIKLIRLFKGLKMFNVNAMMTFVKEYLYSYVIERSKHDSSFAQNIHESNNMIEETLLISYILKIIRVIIIIINASYLVGMFWLIILEIEEIEIEG